MGIRNIHCQTLNLIFRFKKPNKDHSLLNKDVETELWDLI